MSYLYSLLVSLYLVSLPLLNAQILDQTDFYSNDDENPSLWTHYLNFPIEYGGLTIVEKSHSLISTEWTPQAYWWGFRVGDYGEWPLFSVSKPAPSGQGPLVEVDPNYVPPTNVTLLLEFSNTGLIGNWVSLDDGSDDYELRAKVRYKFSPSVTYDELWENFPIYSEQYGAYYFTLIGYRTEHPQNPIIPPFNEPLGVNDQAMVNEFEQAISVIESKMGESMAAAANAPAPPPPSPGSKAFWRVRSIDPVMFDSDNDTISNAQEIADGSNIWNVDTDGDGILDQDESPADRLINAAYDDPDGANHGDLNDSRLLGRWGFESHAGVLTPAREPVGAPNATALGLHTWDGENDFGGMPSKAVHLDGGNWSGGSAINFPGSFLDDHEQYTFSAWFKFPTNPFTNGQQIKSGNTWSGSGEPSVFSIMTITERGPGITATPRFSWVLRPEITVFPQTQFTPTSRVWGVPSYHLALENWEVGPVVSDLAGWTLDQSVLFDGGWHHLALILSDSGAPQAWLDGEQLPNHFAPQNVPTFNFSDDPSTTNVEIGRFGSPFNPSLEAALANASLSGFHEYGPRKSLAASVDRFRVYRTALSESDIESLYLTDIDKDDLLDMTESKTLAWQDLDGDAVQDSGEFIHLLNPFRFDASHIDHDLDGLPSLTEQDFSFTDPADSDTDDDLLPDGWEYQYMGPGIDPLVGAQGALDPDGDTLTNSQEYVLGTNPGNNDTDGDNITDQFDSPPYFVSISRTAKYDYNDYPPEQDPEKSLRTNREWLPRNPTHDELTSPEPYSGLDEELAIKQPFPGTCPSQGLEKSLRVESSAETQTGPLCFHADVQSRRVVLKVPTSSFSSIERKAIVVTKRVLDGVAQPPTVAIEVFTISIDQTESNAVDLTADLLDSRVDNASPNYTESVTKELIPARITVQEDSVDRIGNYVESSLAQSGKTHFVTPKKTTTINDDYVFLEVKGLEKSVFDEHFALEGGEAVPGDSRKVKVDRRVPGKVEVFLKKSSDGQILDRICVWVVWGQSGVLVDQNSYPLLNFDGQGNTAQLSYEASLEHNLLPIEMFTDFDRPNLDGDKESFPPGGNHPISGAPLALGASKKWDSTQQFRTKLVGDSIPPALTESMKTIPSYPQNVVEGNDDAGGIEDNDPYRVDKKGILSDADAPSVVVAHSLGNDGDSVEWRLHFRSFGRLELGRKWYVVTEPFLWRAHLKMRKENSKWVNDGSVGAQDNQGF